MASEIDQELYDQVLEYVSKELRYKKQQLRPGSRIFHDLKCDGMDGDDLIIGFCNHFQVDISNLVLDRHFGPEPTALDFFLIPLALCRLITLNRFNPFKKVPITMMDLYEAAKLKQFPDLGIRPPE